MTRILSTTRGLILGVHRNSPDTHFVVLSIIRRDEYPAVDANRLLAEFRNSTSFSQTPGISVSTYKQVWWQPLDEELVT